MMPNVIKHFELMKKSDDNNSLYIQGWYPEKDSKAVICFVHGLGEHSGRYMDFARFLVKNNIAVVALDLHGHGKSEGKKGHIASYQLLMNDITILINHAKTRFTGIPCIIYGHSMGGNLVLNYVLRHNINYDAIIASAPWLKLPEKPPVYKLAMAWIMNNLWPEFTQSNGIDNTFLSHSKDIIDKYREDPLVHDRISARMFVEIYQAGRWALENADKLDIPLLIMHGSDDHITSYQASRELASRISKDCIFKSWEGFYHEIHNEPGREQAYQYVLEWVNTTINKE